MRIPRKIYCGVPFEPNILSKLIFSGHGIGTFVKDGYIFHRCLITHVDIGSKVASCKWLGITPSHSTVNRWRCTNTITFPTMAVNDEDMTQILYLSNRFMVYAPVTLRAEDEILIHQTTNCYNPVFELR